MISRNIVKFYLHNFSLHMFLLLLVGLLAGCASPGVFLEESAIDKIQPGMTRKEVVQIMGQPGKSHQGPDNTRLDNYRLMLDQPNFSKRTSMAGHMSLRSFQVLYDKDGKVAYREKFMSMIPYWQQLDGTVRGGIRGGIEAIPKMERKTTHITEVTAKIGEPMLIDTDLDGVRMYHWFVCEAGRNNSQLSVTAELVMVLDAGNYVDDYVLSEHPR